MQRIALDQKDREELELKIQRFLEKSGVSRRGRQGGHGYKESGRGGNRWQVRKRGRKQESGRPGIRHDAAPGRILGGHSSGIWLGGSFGVLARTVAYDGCQGRCP